MEAIIKNLIKNDKFKKYSEKIKKTKSPIIVSGLTDVGMIQNIVALNKNNKKRICLITYNEIQARKIKKDLEQFNLKVGIFKKREIVAYDYKAESMDLPYERIDILNKIYNKNLDIVITTIEALMQKMISKSTLYKNIINLKIGDTIDVDDLKEKLVLMGYERIDLIEGKGQFSIRGGIVDIAITNDNGIRLELWGDEIDSIRKFKILSQRSYKMEEEISIYPAHEFILEKDLDTVCNNIKKNVTNIEVKNNILNNEFEEGINEKVFNKEYFDKIFSGINEDLELIKSGDYISKVDKYFNQFYSKQSNFLDYIIDDYIITFEEIKKIEDRRKNIIRENNNLIKMLAEKEKFIPESILNISKFGNEYKENCKILYEKMDLQYVSEDFKKIKTEDIYNFRYREVKYFKSEIELLIDEIKQKIKENKQIAIFAGNEDQGVKFCNLLNEKGIINNYIKNSSLELENGKVIVTDGIFSSGFELYDTELLVISGEELFGADVKRRRKSNNTFKQSEKIVYADLKIGDYVVHKTHGIGQFIGVNTITADKVTKDYIKIKYINDDILYVPTNNLDSVRKYVGAEEGVKLNRLGSKEWTNTKNRVKKNLQTVAKELIELYAKRQKIKGFAYSKDTPWQKQFEDSFPYVETEDQLRCIEETKKDMEEAKPMDRLLCGDVGYGKTEVAIRAAFKAVMDQKQVAYLVPTTVLADQQYQSFKDRMKEFPIRVELLNRFKTKKQQTEIVKKLKLGEIDIIIGTHRILSKDVEFKDLGLLIIDEEHRFGVKAKEKIKQLKSSIDVLTMTATPIPRTLHMSVVGVRDMSVIYEPPQNRKPVQTYVLEYDEEVVKEAITKEIERNGQAFYLFNNVENIEKKAQQIEELIPEAKVAFAHGQMTGSQIEDIMNDFIKGRINVLVCTTILESGIDIPNANTIIVENADRLGLAQLYQIRGRVGRSDKQAYAYIMYKRDKILSEVADKRLKAIKEFTEFGSGFKIAMRDLEIRGAGSLLGEVQHGHLEQVGYDTYCQLLDEVLKEMQGIEVQEEVDVQIDINVSSYIPDEFIEDGSQKIEIYQDIALCRTEEDIQNTIDEIIDRYGEIPREIENLLDIARIKEGCKKSNIIKVLQKKDGIVFLYDKQKFDPQIFEKLWKVYGTRLKFSTGKEPYITLIMKYKNDKQVLNEIKDYISNNLK